MGWLGGNGLRDALGSFFFDLFRGFLALFLLEMGIATAVRLPDVRRVGPFLIGFGVVMPLVGAVIGALLGRAIGLSAGGATLIAVMAASGSHIAVPAAFRVAVPEANPGLSMAAALGVRGLTVHDVRGRGTHGDRPAAWEGDSNIRMEIVCDEALAERILGRIEAQWLPHYALIVYVTDVQVVRPRKF
ncbi:MAG: sodium-dependent bicarbonate transport family permease [Acidobacteriota bacterium]